MSTLSVRLIEVNPDTLDVVRGLGEIALQRADALSIVEALKTLGIISRSSNYAGSDGDQYSIGVWIRGEEDGQRAFLASVFCPECGGEDIDAAVLFPRENSDDMQYQCVTCGHKWGFVATK